MTEQIAPTHEAYLDGPVEADGQNRHWPLLGAAAGVAAGLAVGLAGAPGPGLMIAAAAIGVAALLYPAGACALVLAAAAWGNRDLTGPPWGLQVVHVLCAVAVTAGAVALAAGSRPAGRGARLPLSCAALFVAAAVVSALPSPDPVRSAKACTAFAGGLFLAVALVTVIRSPSRLRACLAAAGVGSLFITIPAVIAANGVEAVYGGADIKNRPSPGFADPNELGSYSALIVLLTLGWLFAARSWWERTAAGLCAGAAAAALIVSMSRGAWFGALLGICVLLLIHPGTRRPIATAAATAATAALGAVLLLPASGPVEVISQRVQSIAEPRSSPYDVRPVTWGEAIRFFGQSPIVGNGPDTFGVLIRRSGSELQFYPREHAHNGILNVAAENGVLGLAALAGLLTATAAAIMRGARRLRAAGDYRRLGALAGGAGALTSVAGHLTVDYPLSNPVLMFVVWTVFGLVLAAAVMPATA